MAPDNALRVMIVDDEAPLRTLVRDTLTAAHYEVREAENGAHALRLLEQAPCDLVLTDLRMEGLSGLDLLRAIQEKHRGIGVFVITGYATLEAAVEAMRNGASDMIEKPVNMSDLVHKINLYAQRRKQEHAAAAPVPGQAAAPETVEVRPVQLPPMHLSASKEAPDGLDKVLDIPVVASVRLGKASLQIGDLLKLGPGSVIELDKRAGEAVELLVNEKLVAIGEVVVVNDTFGLRVTSIVDQKQRVQSLG